MADQLIDDLVRAYLGQKIQRQNILNQNGANLVYLHGKYIGKNLGLSDEVLENITPFPASTKIVVSEANSKSGGVISRRILPLVLGALLGAGTGWGGSTLLKPDQVELQPPPSVEVINTDPQAQVGLSIE